MANDQLTKVAGGLALGFGAAALLTPRTLGNLYGLKGTGDTDALTRLYGSRTAGLGVLAFAVKEPSTRELVLQVAGAISAVDAVGAVLSGVTGRTSARSSAMTALSTAGVSALCVAALRG
jgi:hypothetical protein